MNDAASRVRYVEDGERVIAEVAAYSMPHQSDWVNIDGTQYKVFDVIHTVFPERERMSSTALVWEPDPEATDNELDALYQQAVATRAGDGLDISPPTHGTSGETAEVVHDSEVLTTVTTSILPPADMNKHEGVHVTGCDDVYTMLTTGYSVTDWEQMAGIYLFEMDDAEKSAQTASVDRVLRGQRDDARDRFLNEEGREAYQKLMERVRARERDE